MCQALTIRNFIYVDDVSRPIDTILHFGEINQIYNIGTQNEYSVIDITKKLVKIIKKSDNWEDYIEYVEDRNFNDKRYAICSKKLLNLGWKEENNFENSLDKTINWYLNNNDYWG